MEVLVPMLAYTPVPRRNRIQFSEMPLLLNKGCLSPEITRLVSMLSLALAGMKKLFTCFVSVVDPGACCMSTTRVFRRENWRADEMLHLAEFPGK
eukprot:9579671-Karenia_brevis.AAC.1